MGNRAFSVRLVTNRRRISRAKSSGAVGTIQFRSCTLHCSLCHESHSVGLPTVEGNAMAKKSTGIMDSIEKFIGLEPEKTPSKKKAKKSKKTAKKTKTKKSTKKVKSKTAKKAKRKTKR
jgi:hypothetical protein